MSWLWTLLIIEGIYMTGNCRNGMRTTMKMIQNPSDFYLGLKCKQNIFDPLAPSSKISSGVRHE